MKICAACFVDSNYIDPAIVSINSFRRFNPSMHLIVYHESGMNTRPIQNAVGDDVEFRDVSIPEHFSIYDRIGKNNKYFDLFVPNRKTLTAFTARIHMLQQLHDEFDLIVNFDLDTMFCGSVIKLISGCSTDMIAGVSERENRSRWMTNLHLNDIVPNSNYINTGFVVYGSAAISDISVDDYLLFLAEHPDDVFCPEQDFINFRYGDRIVNIPKSYNLMFTDHDYRRVSPVMIHFYGQFKPWSCHGAIDGSDYYFRKYAIEVQKNDEFLSDEFKQSVTKTTKFNFL